MLDFINAYLNVTLGKRQTNEMIIKHYISSIDQTVSHYSERLRIYDIVPYRKRVHRIVK